MMQGRPTIRLRLILVSVKLIVHKRQNSRVEQFCGLVQRLRKGHIPVKVPWERTIQTIQRLSDICVTAAPVSQKNFEIVPLATDAYPLPPRACKWIR